MAALASVACDRTPKVAMNAATWQLDTVALITGPSQVQRFAGLNGLALHPDGRLAVVDQTAHAVSIFGPSGTFMAPASQFGTAPGQYNNPFYAAWVGDDLAIYDPQLAQVMFLGGGTKPIGSTQVMRVTGSLAARLYPVSAAKAYLRTVMPAAGSFRPVFLGFANAKVTDTIPVPDPPPLATGATCRRDDNTTVFFEWPEAPAVYSVPLKADGSMAFVRTDNYQVVFRSAKGDSTGGFVHPFMPVPIKTGEWNDSLQAYNKFVIRYGARSCDAVPHQPPHRAPVRAVAVSAEGDLWITSLQRVGYAFDVFGADGTPKATLMAPPHDTRFPIVVAGDRLALIVTEGGRQAVRTYHIVRGAKAQ
ncbi:MAG TPA: hypothetical protein VE967_15765 [Gemmatimonadaceae bacterium]|nr:hypothetical protein [Gemmatimonadaceae bacterium]